MSSKGGNRAYFYVIQVLNGSRGGDWSRKGNIKRQKMSCESSMSFWSPVLEGSHNPQMQLINACETGINFLGGTELPLTVLDHFYSLHYLQPGSQFAFNFPKLENLTVFFLKQQRH